MAAQTRSADLIYEALTDDEAFAALPSTLATIYEARSTVIHWHHADGTAEVLAHSGYFTDAQMALYAQSFAPLDPWAGAAIAAGEVNRATNLETLITSEEFEQSSFYNDYIRAMGDDTFRCMGVLVANRFGTGMIALQRGKSQARFERDELAALARDVHHLRRMLCLRGTLHGLERRVASLEGALDTFLQPTFLLQRGGEISHMNAAAVRLLEQEELIGIREGCLAIKPSSPAPYFRMALAAATRPDSPEAGAVLVPRAANRPLHLSLAPVVVTNGARQALLVVQDPFAIAPEAAGQLRALFGLSYSEARIAVRLAEGLDALAIAVERQVSVGTVRVQIKAIARKLRCRRQCEIVGVVRGLPSLAKAMVKS